MRLRNPLALAAGVALALGVGSLVLLAVPAGETRELIHTFGAPGDLQVGCHVPGHYGAGMYAAVAVTP